MRVVWLILLVACGGTKKYALAPASPEPVSQLEQHAQLEADIDAAQIDERSSDLAVRSRREPVSWQDIVVVNRQSVSSSSSGSPSAPPPAQPLASPEPKQSEQLVIEAWIDLSTEHVARAVSAIRARVEASGGRVVSENVSGSGESAASAALEVRVPPAQAVATTEWLGTLGAVTSKRVLASDVSKTLFDQDLALQNLRLTMERLQKLATQSGPVEELLAIEKEMTRVRGEIEKLEGEQRWLVDRVAFATITVTIRRSGDEPYEDVPEARVYPGPQLAMLTLLDPGMRERTRFGGGVGLRVNRYATFELAVFPRAENDDSRTVIATFGSALYSSYLRDGHRRYLNPYLGGRIGFGHLSGHSSPVVAGELGVELVKHEYLVVDASLRALAFVRESADTALDATLGVSVPF